MARSYGEHVQWEPAEEMILTVTGGAAEKHANPGYWAFLANGFNVTRRDLSRPARSSSTPRLALPPETNHRRRSRPRRTGRTENDAASARH